MLNHVSIGVRDVARAAEFYDAVFNALGYRRVMDVLPHAVAYGTKQPEFWVQLPRGQQELTIGNGAHISFAAATKGAIEAFYTVALKNGGKDDGAPGLRPEYAPDYYAAFVIDPDGNRLEAVLTIVQTPAKAKKAAAKKAAAKKTAPAKKPAPKAAVKKASKKAAPAKSKPAKVVKAAKAPKATKGKKIVKKLAPPKVDKKKGDKKAKRK